MATLNPPRPNPLSEFSSYTYNISLYLITPESYNQYSTGGAKDVNNWQLIAQSGGINNKGNTPRAPGFELDYYIDNLYITTNTNFKMTSSPTHSFDFSFQIIEPYGFKFQTNFVKAVREMQKKSGLFRKDIITDSSVALQAFCMLVVRFYGYDNNGNIVKQTATQDPTVTDTTAALERSWPIRIVDVTFRLDGKMVVHNIKAKLPSELLAMGRLQGVLGSEVQISGSTVGEMLSSLTDALNAQQKALVDSKKYSIADTYEIKFAPNSNIDTAAMLDPKIAYNKTTPMATVTSPDQSNIRTSSNASTVAFNKQTMSVSNQPIINVIDQIITQSSYVYDTLNTLTIEETQSPDSSKPATNDTLPNSDSGKKPLTWFMVVPSVTLNEADTQRGSMHSAKITFIISPHNIPDIRGFNIGKLGIYPGPYKRYQHTYLSGTGKEILSFEQNYNLSFFNLMADTLNYEKNIDQTVPAGIAPGSDVNSQGKVNDWIGKSIGPIKTYLYGDATHLTTKMTILGDPDYLITATARGFNKIIDQLYGEDGHSINTTTGQIFVEVDFRDADDYDNNTGLLNTGKDTDNFFYNYPPGLGIQGMALTVWQVTSHFSNGVFTQELKFAVPALQNQAAQSASGIGNMNSASLNPANGSSATTIPSGVTITPTPASAEPNN
jgi:hypothetical protein